MATIQRVLAPNPGLMTGTGTNTYLLAGVARQVAVVDPGPRDRAHVEAIRAAAEPLGAITTILVTHGHLDHLPAAALLGEQVKVPVSGHPSLPGVEHVLQEGDVITLGDQRLHALATPGHTDDSLSFWLAEEHALFTGDVVAGSGTVVVDDSPGGLERYLRSLTRLLGLGECVIYPGHGPRVDAGRGKLVEYIEHRAQREQQVLEGLAAGGESGRTVEGLVAAIYTEVPQALQPMAARNVRSHLGKLAGERRVHEVAGVWRIMSEQSA